jgi:hypothetical protein
VSLAPRLQPPQLGSQIVGPDVYAVYQRLGGKQPKENGAEAQLLNENRA